MTIELRITEALDEFEALVGSGASLTDAAGQAGNSYGIKPDVLLVRAGKRFGDLASLATRLQASASNARRAAAIRSSTCQYCQTYYGESPRDGDYVDVFDWLEAKLNLRLTAPEKESARAEVQQAFHRRMMQDLDRLLREERLNANAEN